MAELCAHLRFTLLAKAYRIEDVVAFVLEVAVQCADCRERFVFAGMPIGASSTQPMVAWGGEQARLPIRPASSAAEWGGYAIEEKL